MKTILTALITGGLLVAAWQTAEAQTRSFVVATDGNDAKPGTKDRPLATLEGARQALRGAPQDSPRSVIVGSGAQPRVNRAKNNVLVRCEQASSGNWEFKPAETWITDHDPGFINAAQGDYRLGPEAEVFQRLPGFQSIPVEKFGVYPSSLRASWPIQKPAGN